MPFSLGHRQGGGNVIDIREATAAKINWLCAVWRRPSRSLHLDQPPAQSLIHQLFQRPLKHSPQVLDPGSNVIIER